MTNEGLAEAIVLSKIYIMRGRKVMLDADLAELYTVKTQQLNQQVRRNPSRFPSDFMFELTREEFDELKSGPGAASWGGRRKLPLAFTEHGVLMLSSVLRSEKAVEVNIRIVRIFSRMRELLASTTRASSWKVERIERELYDQAEDIATIYGYVTKLIEEPVAEPTPEPERRRIGYRRSDES